MSILITEYFLGKYIWGHKPCGFAKDVIWNLCFQHIGQCHRFLLAWTLNTWKEQSKQDGEVVLAEMERNIKSSEFQKDFCLFL